MSYRPLQYFSLFFVAISLMSVNQWSRFPIGNTFVGFGIAFAMLGIVFWYGIVTKSFADSELRLCGVYLIWLVISIIRGFFVAENYWEYKQLVAGSLALSMPLFVFYFKEPLCLSLALQKWNNWFSPLFFLFFFWVISSDAYHFLLTPILLYGCFFKNLPAKWKVFVGIGLTLMLLGDFGARAQVMKAIATILCAVTFSYRGCVREYLLKIIHWLCYIGPIVLLILGISGTFNVFKDSVSEKSYDKYTQTKVINGQVKRENLAADTRTFIYEEVILSAIKHDYVLFGRTPARGNDSFRFGTYGAEELKTGKYERHSNELCHLNVFTWLGLIGLFLHCAIYLLASYRAVYYSKNKFVKYIGIMVAFNWALGWIENFTRFDIMNLTIWIMISICLSRCFREMNDAQFVDWFRFLFSKKGSL